MTPSIVGEHLVRRPRCAPHAHGASNDSSSDGSGGMRPAGKAGAEMWVSGREATAAGERSAQHPDVRASGDAASDHGSEGQSDAHGTPGQGWGGWGLCGSAFMCPTFLSSWLLRPHNDSSVAAFLATPGNKARSLKPFEIVRILGLELEPSPTRPRVIPGSGRS